MKEIKVLIVDDSTFSRNLLKNIISGELGGTDIRATYIEARNGNEAAYIYKKEKPDVVFMDITMPDKNGIEALKEIKAFDKNAKVIMCSAMGQKAYINEAVNIGIVDFIVKPFNDKGDRIGKMLKRLYRL